MTGCRASLLAMLALKGVLSRMIISTLCAAARGKHCMVGWCTQDLGVVERMQLL